MHCLSLSTTSVDFNTPPLTSVLPTDSCPNNSMHRGSLCHHRAFMGSKSCRQLPTWRQSVHKISRCILSLLCILTLLCFLHLLSWSVHREKCSNLSTIHWFDSACTSVSMFTINADNCPLQCSFFSPGPCVHIGFPVRQYRGCNPSPDPS